jgi:hypothetical protein
MKKVDNFKHIEVEPMPDEIVKAAFDNNLRKENTLRQYVLQTLRLHESSFEGSEELRDLRWVKTDCAKLVDFLKDVYSDKLPAQHGYIFTVMIIAKDHLRDMALWKVYFDRHEDIRKAREALKSPLQQMTEHEGANWKTLERITKKREELQRRVHRLILLKQPANITMGDRIDLIRHLILCLYAYLPTLRNDYSNCFHNRSPIISNTKIDARQPHHGNGKRTVHIPPQILQDGPIAGRENVCISAAHEQCNCRQPSRLPQEIPSQLHEEARYPHGPQL